MENEQTIAQWQQFLQALAPVDGWLYIGAGRGEVLRETRFAKVPRLLAVEAEPHASQLLAHAIAPHSNDNRSWKALHALVNNTDGQANWHQLSREEESGLLPADTLSALWPNVDEHQRSEHPAVSLSRLLEQTGENPAHYNWLTIDCLPAARLLQGLNGNLEPLDMIEVRVAVGGIASRQTGATLEECDNLLLPRGFTRLVLEEANNPLIGRALYGRNFKRQLIEARRDHTELKSQNDALTLQSDELKIKIESIQKERESIRNELEEQWNRKSQINEKLQQAQAELKTLTLQRDELAVKNEATQKESESIRNKLQVQQSRESEIKEKLRKAEVELIEQQRSARLSTKLLAKVEADASDLRERYAEKVKSEQELKDLIKELHAKLQAASQFYHKLEREHPDLLEKL